MTSAHPEADGQLKERMALVGTLLGCYRIIELIGEGGMGAVYKARNNALNREVALKLIAPVYAGNPRLIKRFYREAHAAAQMTHPNIVAIHNIGQVREFHFIEMEYVAGETLGGIIERQAPMPPGAALPVLKQIARAVAAAHSHRIIHRDIKPDNVIVTADGIVKVADFGLAKCLDEEGRGTTSASTNLGTPLFMAPERFDAVNEDPRSDLYSIGVVAYLMLTRQYPCSGASVIEIMRSHKRISPRPIRELNPGVTPALSAVVHKLLEKRLEDRFADAKSFLQALTAASAPGAGPGKGKMRKAVLEDTLLLKRFVIEFIAGPLEGHRICISTTAPVTIGRGKDMDVQVDDLHLSKRHARLSVSSGRLKVEDLRSRHGVWLKGKRVSAAFVAPGDTLRMAQSLLRVAKSSAPAEGQPPGRSSRAAP